MRTAADLLAEAAGTPFTGWDFSPMAERIHSVGPPWSFDDIVTPLIRGASSLLDLGTGGGEWLATLGPWPRRTVADEAWPSNAPVAAARLHPLGIPCVRDEGARDNCSQDDDERGGRLPFRDGAFDLVLDRHEAFTATEVARVLRHGGWFVTQQADPGTLAFHDLLGLDPPGDHREFRLGEAVRQVSRCGLMVEESGEGTEQLTFTDIGALAWYLDAVPWAVPGFTVERHRDQLERLHGRELTVAASRFWLLCRR